jgi:(2Fe-2S) ferredoxin
MSDEDGAAPASRFKRHFFVCLKERPPSGKPSCGPRGGVDIYNHLQESLGSHEELWGDVCVTVASCLGPCLDGPMMVVYPEGTWYAGVAPSDVDEIVEQHLVGGAAVERLRYRWPTED